MDDLRPHYSIATVTLPGTFVAGEKWTLNVDNRTYTYTTGTDTGRGNRNLSTIAQAFVDLINADSVASFKATMGAGGSFTLSDKVAGVGQEDPFIVELGRGGSVRVVLDIDKSTLVSGFSNVPFASFFGFQFFNSYAFTASTVIELYDQNDDLLAQDFFTPGDDDRRCRQPDLARRLPRIRHPRGDDPGRRQRDLQGARRRVHRLRGLRHQRTRSRTSSSRINSRRSSPARLTS